MEMTEKERLKAEIDLLREKAKVETCVFREALRELEEKMNANAVLKPKSCQYCKYYIQHYMKGGGIKYTQEYVTVYAGHCVRGVPVKNGGRRNPTPDDTCPYFEIGTDGMRL